MSSRRTIMNDTVDMAGVTRSIMPRYSSGGNVKEPTRERTQEITGEYNYESSTFARLEAKGSNVIGMALPILNSKVPSWVVTSVGRYLREQGYETLIKDSDHSVDLELRNIQGLITLKVGGIILGVITIIKAHRNLIQESLAPVVVAAQEYDGGVSIVHDDYGAGKAMGVRVGRATSAWVGYMRVSDLDVVVGLSRRQGMMDGLKEYGIKNVATAIGDYSYVNGIRMAEEILGQGPVDTIICATDRLTLGTYHVSGERGLRTLEDVSAAGFGRHDESTLLKPEPTTLCFGSHGLGCLGAETALKMTHREPVSKKQIVDYRIIKGGSVRK